MFSAPRVAVAVTTLSLVAGLSYVAVPAVERAIVPAAPAFVSAEDFAGFTGSFRAVGCRDGEMTSYEWGHTIEGDYCSPMTLEVSDDRLSGTARAAHNAVRFKNGATYGVRTLTTEIVNEGGTWSGTGVAFHDMDDKVMRYEFLLSGSGDYEGLSAMLSLVSDTTYLGHEAEGIIFPGELPPYPVFDGAEPDVGSAITAEIDPADYGGYKGSLSASTGGMDPGESELGQYGSQTRGEHWSNMTLETNDARMSGTQESFLNANNFAYTDESGLIAGRAHTTTDRIVTDDGWWDQTAWGYQHPDNSEMHYVNQLTGHGAYEGLSAIDFVSQDGYRLDRVGVIFPGELPPLPELPPAAED